MLSILRGLVLGHHDHEESEAPTAASLILAKPKPIEAKDYPIFQLQQAFEEKEFDVKKVVTILRDKQFTTACPDIEQIQLLPIWLNAMSSKNPQFAELLLVLQAFEQEYNGLPAGVADAKDAKAIIDAYSNVLSKFIITSFKIKELLDGFLSPTTNLELEEEDAEVKKANAAKYRDCLKEMIKKIGKKDLKEFLTDMHGVPQGFFYGSFPNQMTIYEFLTRNLELALVEARPIWQSFLDVIDAQPDEIPLNPDATSDYEKNQVNQSAHNYARAAREQALLKAFDLCILCFEYLNWRFPISVEQIALIMVQLITAVGQEKFINYLAVRSTKKFMHYDKCLPKMFHRDTNFDRIAWNEKLLHHALGAMRTAGIETTKLVVMSIYTLIDRFKTVEDKLEMDTLSQRVIKLMAVAKIEDLVSKNGIGPMLSEHVPGAVLKCFLLKISDSAIDCHSITIDCHDFRSEKKLVYTAIGYLCASEGDYFHKYTEDKFKDIMKALIYAGFDPSKEIKTKAIPEKYLQFTKQTFDEYRRAHMQNTEDGLLRFSLDLVSVVSSHCFYPLPKPTTTAVAPSIGLPAQKTSQ